MSTVTECYRRYRIPPNLQRHMLRVAAVAELLAGSWTGPSMDLPRLRRVLLVHDLGNLVKCDYATLPEMLEEEQHRLAYWTGVQQDCRNRYGADAEQVTRTMAVEIGLDDGEMRLLDAMAFGRNRDTRDGDDYTVKVAAYADQRVAPRGIVSLTERFDEARARYATVGQSYMASPRARALFEAGADIERQVFQCAALRPRDITDASAAPIVDRLRHFEM